MESVGFEQAQEPVLISRFPMNEDNLREVAKDELRIPILLNYLFAAVMLFVAVYTAIRCFNAPSLELRLLFRPVFSLVITGLLIYQALTVEKRSVERTMQRLEKEIGSRDSVVILFFFPDCYYSENSELSGRTRREYSDVTQLTRAKNRIYLTMQGVRGYTLDPARFENGTEADFWKLMNEKCPRAVPRKYRPGAQNA